MRKIKIAQIGSNGHSHSSQIFKSISEQNDVFEVVGYVLPENERERLPQRVEELKQYPELSLEEVLNNPEIEAVTVETDEIYLTRYALMAAKAGKHIHMEKPGGVGLPEFENLIAEMKKTGKVFHTGYMYRYNPYVQDLLAKIKKGDLGDILSVEAQMSCTLSTDSRQWLEAFPGGMMFYLGCHLVDLILLIQGQPDHIIPLNRGTGFEGVTAQDYGMAVFEYKNGVSFAKTSAVEPGGYSRRQLVVTGTKGTVEIKPFEIGLGNGLIYTGRRECFTSGWHDWGEYEKTEPFNRYDEMMRSFASYVRGDRQNPYSYDYELEVYKTVLKACNAKI